jgi:hypothetical protein
LIIEFEETRSARTIQAVILYRKAAHDSRGHNRFLKHFSAKMPFFVPDGKKRRVPEALTPLFSCKCPPDTL